MKQLIAIIKAQIQQLEHRQLKEWLLVHVNDNARSLHQIFVNHPSDTFNPMQRFPSFIEPLPLPLALFYTIAPASLCQELTAKLLMCSPVYHDENSSLDIRLNQKLSELLADYQQAWPVIVALQKTENNDLLQVLNHAEPQALIAFGRLTEGTDLPLLVNTFLAKENNDLELIDRNRLFQFLRRPDLIVWLSAYLDSLVSQPSHILSLKLLVLIFSPTDKKMAQFAEIGSLLRENSFSLSAEVIHLVIHYYFRIAQEPSYLASNEFLGLLHELMQRMDRANEEQLIAGLAPEYFQFVIELCLRGCVNKDVNIQLNSKHLLSRIGLAVTTGNRDLMQKYLGQPDSYLFDNDPSLGVLARNFITATAGTWLECLLTSPHFVAACTPRVLQRLIDRYYLFTLTLSLDDYRALLLSFGEELPYQEEIQVRLRQSSHHGDKKNQFYEFCSDRIIHALLIRLEEACDQEKSRDITTATRALVTLYGYYGLTISGLVRTDIALCSAEYFYQPCMRPLKKGKSILEAWYKKNLFPSLRKEWHLERKKNLLLHDSKGQKIAFLNEYNQVVTLDDQGAVLLADTGLWQVTDPLYDNSGSIIGYLTETGQMRHDRPEQKNISACFLAQVPIKTLEQSAHGLLLLFQNVLCEESIDMLYQLIPYADPKRLWVEERISAVVKEANYRLSSNNLNAIVRHHNDNALFALLAALRYPANVISLFHGLVSNDRTRDLFLKGVFAIQVHQFLHQYGAVECLAYYMARFYSEPWFNQGLKPFAQYATVHKKESLLGEVLDLLAIDQQEVVDRLLMHFVNSESSAAVVLQEFFNDRAAAISQPIKSPVIHNVVQHFRKKHLIAALQILNTMPQWEDSALYKLVVYILTLQYDSLFQEKRVTSSWHDSELRDLTGFVTRYLEKKCPLDQDSTLGFRILGDLIFRTAQAGQTALFYRNKTFNAGMARLSLTRSFLERLVDKFWIPDGIKEQFADVVARIRLWSDDHSLLQKEMAGIHPLTDWRHLIRQTWNEINKRKLPVICAYLLNYSGPKKPLACLLRDYITTFQHARDYLYPVGKLLEQFPQREVSGIIFAVLEIMVIKDPSLLDKNILHSMGYYLGRKKGTSNREPFEDELNLLIYFGQFKHYLLVQAGCAELAACCDDPNVIKRLAKGANEARVEADLSLKKGYFYFTLIKFVKRLWHYGLNAQKNLSGIIRLCDDNTPPPERFRHAQEVKTPVAKTTAHNTYLDFPEKRKQFISLLAAMKQCSSPAALITRASKSSQSLFHDRVSVQEIAEAQETAVAQEKAVVHI